MKLTKKEVLKVTWGTFMDRYDVHTDRDGDIWINKGIDNSVYFSPKQLSNLIRALKLIKSNL